MALEARVAGMEDGVLGEAESAAIPYYRSFARIAPCRTAGSFRAQPSRRLRPAHFFRPMIEHFQLKLADSHMLAPSVRHLAFERADGTRFKFTPGQFIQIHFNYDDGKPTKRSYSVGTPAESSEVGRLEHGGTVDASGPYGRFCLMDDDANQRYLLIATGTGITPYRAMLPKIE